MLALFLGSDLAAVPPRGLDMDYGPFLSYSVLKPANPQPTTKKVKRQPGDPTPAWGAGDLMATKGIVIKLPGNAAICFDTDTCRYAAAWTGGWLDISKCNLAHVQGPLPAIAKGRSLIRRINAPGYAKDGKFADLRIPNSDRRVEGGEGPLPRDWAHYRGLYRDGDAVVLSYTVGDVGRPRHARRDQARRRTAFDAHDSHRTQYYPARPPRFCDDPAAELGLAEKQNRAAALQQRHNRHGRRPFTRQQIEPRQVRPDDKIGIMCLYPTRQDSPSVHLDRDDPAHQKRRSRDAQSFAKRMGRRKTSRCITSTAARRMVGRRSRRRTPAPPTRPPTSSIPRRCRAKTRGKAGSSRTGSISSPTAAARLCTLNGDVWVSPPHRRPAEHQVEALRRRPV